MKLVTLAQARAHLRSDTDADDADLGLKIEAASEAVVEHLQDTPNLQFLDSAGEPYLDSNGDAIGIPKRVQQATLMLIGHFYRERDGSNESAVPAQWGFGYLPAGVEALLYSLKKPGVY